MRKLLFIAVLLIPGLASSETVSSFKFKGLNNNENSVIIDPSEAQDLLNVDVSPGGASFSKRDGFGIYKTLATAQPQHGGYHFFDSTGNDVQVWGSSTSLYGVVGGATPTQLISSATLSSIWDCADSQGSSYCVNSNRNAFVKTNGATMTWYATPLGTMVETTPDRVVVAGVSGTPNTLYFSQSNTFTNFVVGLNSTDPFTEVIASPGSKLTNLRWGCGKLLWWKDQSMGTMDFDDQFNVQIKTVSDTIGTFDNTSAIDPGGNVWFRGQDGHTYKYDCSFITKESVDITPNTQVTGLRIANSWMQTSASDFANGYFAGTSTSSVVGAVTLGRLTDSFSSLSNWTQNQATIAADWGTGVSTFVASGGFVYQDNSVSGSQTADMTSILVSSVTNNWKLKATFQNSSTGMNGVCDVLFSTGPTNGKNGYGFQWGFLAGDQYFTILGPSISVATSKNRKNPVDTASHTLELNRSATGYMTISYDNVLSTTTLQDNTIASNFGYVRLVCFTTTPNLGVVKFSNITVTASTGVYYSTVNNATTMSSWNTLGVNSVDDGGSHAFSVRSSTSFFTTTSSTPAWTTQSAGSLITISTGTYFQFADSFTVTLASQTPTLNDFTFNWFQGASSDQSYMLYFDNAIWQSVAFGAGQGTNNYIFKYDLINQAWTLYNFGAGGMLVQANQLYFGDTSSGGNIFIFGSGTSDNGTAINAYWKGKDFPGQDPFVQNQLQQVDVFAKKDNGTTLTSTYTTDASSSTAYSVILSTSSAISQSRKLLPSGKLGYTMNLKLGDTSTSSAWEVFGYRFSFIPLPYRPTQ